MNRFREKNVQKQQFYFWARKWHISLILGIIRIFLENSKLSLLYLLFNISHQIQFQKNLMNRCREKFKSFHFRAKYSPFTSCRATQEFISKKKPPLFFRIYWILSSCKKSEKNNELILRKKRYRWMDRRTNEQRQIHRILCLGWVSKKTSGMVVS